MATRVSGPDAKDVATLAAMIFAAEVQSRGGIMLGNAGAGERRLAVGAAIDLIRQAEEQLGEAARRR